MPLTCITKCAGEGLSPKLCTLKIAFWKTALVCVNIVILPMSDLTAIRSTLAQSGKMNFQTSRARGLLSEKHVGGPTILKTSAREVPRFLTHKMQQSRGFGRPIKLSHHRCHDFGLTRCNTTKDSAYPPSWHTRGVTVSG